jgi:hypothetical protein
MSPTRFLCATKLYSGIFFLVSNVSMPPDMISILISNKITTNNRLLNPYVTKSKG